MKLKYLVILSLIILFTACQVKPYFPLDEMQPSLLPVTQSGEFEQQVMIFNDEMDSNLCIKGEKIILSFKFEDSDKILTVATSNELDYLVCRMGTKDLIELEFPQDKTDSWNQFYYQYYRRGGGYQNLALTFDYLSFETDAYRYTVFWESRAIDEDQYQDRIGLTLTDKESIREKGESDATKIVMEGDLNSITGSMDELRDTKIKKSFE